MNEKQRKRSVQRGSKNQRLSRTKSRKRQLDVTARPGEEEEGCTCSLTGLHVSQSPVSVWQAVKQRPRCSHLLRRAAPALPVQLPGRLLSFLTVVAPPINGGRQSEAPEPFSPNENCDWQLTGVVLQAAKRLQINVHVEKVPFYRYVSPRLHHPHFLPVPPSSSGKDFWTLRICLAAG